MFESDKFHRLYLKKRETFMIFQMLNNDDDG
jgi:hypothetical protein